MDPEALQLRDGVIEAVRLNSLAGGHHLGHMFEAHRYAVKTAGDLGELHAYAASRAAGVQPSDDAMLAAIARASSGGTALPICRPTEVID